MSAQLTAWVFLFLAAVNSTIGNLCLKQSRLVVDRSDFISLILQPYFIAGLVFYAINVILFAKSLDVLKVSLAYPVLAAGGFTLLVIASQIFIGEQLNSKQYAGVAIVLIGVFLLASE
ncbi:MAG: SMR family transporter [Gammaproteobacteria bacterium]|nr:SMR family transporter [Gammaproteobacteria bacterium]